MSTIVLFPGLGATEKLFSQYDFDGRETFVANFLVPERGEKLKPYCNRMIGLLPQRKDLILIGVSFGGIVALEISRMIAVKKIILISSIKSVKEKPDYFKWVRLFPVYRILPIPLLKWTIIHFGDWFTPKSLTEQDTFLAMVHEANPKIIRWGIRQTLRWSAGKFNVPVIHIHGSKDRLFPIRYIKADHVIRGGSHFMVIQRSVEINTLLKRLLDNS
jgi:pimeloyl-ACP methyl ester carboxylesterase